MFTGFQTYPTDKQLIRSTNAQTMGATLPDQPNSATDGMDTIACIRGLRN